MCLQMSFMCVKDKLLGSIHPKLLLKLKEFLHLLPLNITNYSKMIDNVLATYEVYLQAHRSDYIPAPTPTVKIQCV